MALRIHIIVLLTSLVASSFGGTYHVATRPDHTVGLEADGSTVAVIEESIYTNLIAWHTVTVDTNSGLIDYSGNLSAFPTYTGTTVVQTTSDAAMLEIPFWSSDGSTMTTKTTNEITEYVSGNAGLYFKYDSNTNFGGYVQFTNSYTPALEEYTNLVQWNSSGGDAYIGYPIEPLEASDGQLYDTNNSPIYVQSKSWTVPTQTVAAVTTVHENFEERVGPSANATNIQFTYLQHGGALASVPPDPNRTSWITTNSFVANTYRIINRAVDVYRISDGVSPNFITTSGYEDYVWMNSGCGRRSDETIFVSQRTSRTLYFSAGRFDEPIDDVDQDSDFPTIISGIPLLYHYNTASCNLADLAGTDNILAYNTGKSSQYWNGTNLVGGTTVALIVNIPEGETNLNYVAQMPYPDGLAAYAYHKVLADFVTGKYFMLFYEFGVGLAIAEFNPTTGTYTGVTSFPESINVRGNVIVDNILYVTADSSGVIRRYEYEDGVEFTQLDSIDLPTTVQYPYLMPVHGDMMIYGERGTGGTDTQYWVRIGDDDLSFEEVSIPSSYGALINMNIIRTSDTSARLSIYDYGHVYPIKYYDMTWE